MLRTAGLAGCALSLLAVAWPASGVAGEAQRCNGKKVDISSNQEIIRGTEGSDVIRGGRSTRRILGLGGRDTICGGSAHNQIDGGSGVDTMLGGAGRDQFLADATDTVVGGGGADYVTYEGASGVEVDLAKGVVRSVVALGDEGASGILTGVENVIGTDFADELRGDRHDNRINGRDGNDFVDGRGGEDLLLAGDGARDEVSYESAPARVRTAFDPREGGHALNGFVKSDKDKLVGFDVVTGSDFDDSLGGTERGDSLYGGKGDDTLKGLEGNDLLFGGPGNDIFAPGPGDDRLEGGPNRPVTGTKQPGDLINFRHAKFEPETIEGEVFLPEELDVCFDSLLCGGRPRPWNASGEGHDVFKEIESVRGMQNERNALDGDDGPNVLVGGKKEDYIHGWGGNDHLFALGFPDNLWGDDGDDYLDPGGDDELMDGGEGTDTCLHRSEEHSLDCEKGG